MKRALAWRRYLAAQAKQAASHTPTLLYTRDSVDLQLWQA